MAVADLTQDRRADPRRLRRRSGRLLAWPCSRNTWAGRADVVLRGRNTRLPNPLCLVFGRELDDYPADQLAAARGHGQDRRCDGRGARHYEGRTTEGFSVNSPRHRKSRMAGWRKLVRSALSVAFLLVAGSASGQERLEPDCLRRISLTAGH